MTRSANSDQYVILLRQVGKRSSGTILKGRIRSTPQGAHGRAFSVDVSEHAPDKNEHYYYESIFEWYQALSRDPDHRIWRELSPLEVLAAQSE